MTNKKIFLLFFLLLCFFVKAQVGIGTTTPHSGAALDLTSNNKALLITRVSNVAAISSPVNGMIVYDLSLNCFRGYQNGSWTDCNFSRLGASTASISPMVCINTTLPVITHATTGATGIGSPTGLPSGVSASWANATITITGVPTVAGIFNYNIPLIGGGLAVSATGTITVTSLCP